MRQAPYHLSHSASPELFFAVPEFELRAYTLSHSTSPFIVIRFLEIRSWELCVKAGFEP
jgi:hypothetical protein